MLYTETIVQARIFREKARDIRSVLLHANKAPYYRAMLGNTANGDDFDYARFLEIPVTDDEALRLNTGPERPNMFTGPLSGCYIFSTGGTTGRPKLTYREFAEFEVSQWYFGGLNFGPEDVVANLFTPGIWGSFTSHNKGLERLGCTVLPLGAFALQDNYAHNLDTLFAAVRVNGVIATPSICVVLAKKLGGEARRAITKVYCAGEMMYPATLNALSGSFPNARIGSLYGTVDFTGIGYQCAHLRGSAYHPFHYVFLEVINDDGTPADDGAGGRLIVTNLRHRLVPMIRYEVGDLGCYEADDCSGGCGSPVFRLAGRSKESLLIASAIVRIESFGNALSRITGTTGRFQLTLTKLEGLDKIGWDFECRTNEPLDKITSEAIMSLGRLEPELAAYISEGKCHGISVNVIEPGALEHVGISGKTRKIFDRRFDSP